MSPDGENPFDQFDEEPAAATSAGPAPQTIVDRGRPMSSVGALPQPTEADQQGAAREAREAAGRVPRQRAQPQETVAPARPQREGEGVYDQFDSDPSDDGVALMERLRLNRQEAFYRGSVPGSAKLAILANVYRSQDPPEMAPEMKKARQDMRDEYVKVVADLAAHDEMQPWGTTMEAMAALGGQLEGTLIDPTAWIGWGAKGVTFIWRTVRAGLQQGAIQVATDPVVQGLNISADVQEGYDPLRTAVAGATGFGIGAGGHMIGEGLGKVVGQHQLRKQLAELGREDPSFDAPRQAAWALDPNNGIPARPEAPPQIEPPRAETPAARSAPAPEREFGFEDRVNAEKERLEETGGKAEEAQAKAFDDEIGTRISEAMDAQGIPRTDLEEIRSYYKREEGETVEVAAGNAVDEYVAKREQAVDSVPDPALKEDLAQSEPAAANEIPFNSFTPTPEAMEEARRMSRGWPPRQAKGTAPQSLYQFVRKNGGLLKDSPEAADLLSQDIGRQPGFLRSKEAGGIGYDDMAIRARDAGYDIGPDTGEGNGINAERFMRMLEEDASGRQKHYPKGADTEGHFNTLAHNDETLNYLKNVLGVNPKGMDPLQIAWLLSQERASERASRTTSQASGGVPAGGRAEPGAEGRTAGGDAGEPTSGPASRPGIAGGEANVPAATDRGEKLGGPAETLGGKPLSERTAQGEQTLIPGVAPVTDRARAEAQMAKSLRGGNAPMPEGSLFDEAARAQTDMFDAAPSGREMEPQGIAQRKKGGKMEGEPERVPVEKPEPASPEQDVAIRSLQQQSFDLAKALDFPLRQGRVRSRLHAGEFMPRSGVVRVREVPDFDVVSHEAGHAIESKIGPDLTALTKANDVELRALDYDQTKRRVNEGFAEYVRLMMTNPAYADRVAPTFAVEFRAFMSARAPEMLEKIDQAAQAYRAYLAAPSVDAVGVTVRSIHEDPTFVQRTAAALTKDELPNTVKSVVTKVYDTMFDDKAPFTRFVREMGKAIAEREGKPLDLKAADNPDILLRLSERSRQAATLNLQYGVRGYHETHAEGPSLTDALSEALGQQSWWGKYNEGARKDFSAYLVARRAEYLWRKFDAGEIPNPPVAFSHADAVQAMADLEAAHGDRLRNASDMVHQYTRQILKKAFDGGLIQADRHEKLLAEEFYVPFMRDVSDKPVTGSGMGQGAEGPGTTAIVRRLRGSARDIIDPLESIMGQTFLIERTLAHNDVVKSMAELSRRAGPEGGKYVEPIPVHEAKMYTADLEQAIESRAKAIGMDVDEARQMIASLGGLEGDAITGNYFMMERAAGHGEPIVFYREGGELKAVRVMAKEEGLPLYELLTAAPPVVTDIWANLVATAGALKRSSIITNPSFMVTNYIRDQVAASLLRPDYVPFYGGIRGMVDEWRQGNNAILYAYAGGVAGGRAIGVVDKAAERDINALDRKGYSVTRVPTVKELMELASFTEAGTRNSVFATVYDSGMRKGLSSYEAMVEAAYAAQDLLDFSRHGSATLWVRRFLPFFNAHLQGLDKARRVMIEPIINRLRDGKVFERDSADFNNALLTWTKTGAVGMSLGAIYAAVMSENEAYRDASPYFKGTHFVVPFGNKVFVVPKPFELGLGFTMGEYGFHALAEKDPRAMRMLREAAWDVIAPPNPIADMPIVTPAIELAVGKSLFTGRDIVPEQIQRLPPAQQFTDRTSELGKSIGKAIGVSPIKVDYAIASQFATWGRDVMAMSQGVSENTPAASLDDAVFFRRFVKDPTRSSDVTTRFWDYMGRTTGKFNQDVAGYNDLVKEAVTRGAPLSAANDFLSKLPAAERAFVTLKSGARDDGKPAFTADERRLHPIQHAYDAVEMLNGLRKELGTNAQMSFGGREKIVLNPVQRRDLLENVRELAQMEMRNGLAIMGDGGFAGRPILNPDDTMAKIRAISPAVADEIASRYATAKIFSTEAIRRAWPQLRDELVRNGTQADIKGLAFDAKADGYQFGGVRAKRPGITRLPIAPQAVPAP